MLITQRELDRYRDQVRSRQDDAYAYVAARLQQEASGMTVAEAREDAIGIIEDCLAVYGDQAQAVSASFFDEICAAEGIDAATGEMFDDVIDSSKLADKVHYYAGKLVDGDWDGYVGSNADLAAYYVHRSALENMERNCDANHVRYARAPTGRETCSWCFMLASRDFDYRSEKSAAAASHPHCDCVVVPGVKGRTRIEGYDPDGMRKRMGVIEKSTGLRFGDDRRQMDALTREMQGMDQKWLHKGEGEFSWIPSRIRAAKNAKASSWNDGQSALLSGVAEHHGNPNKSLKRWTDAKVRCVSNLDVVATAGYKRAVANLFGNALATTAYKDIGHTLKVRSGTFFESLYAYDLTTWERISFVDDCNIAHAVYPSDEMKAAVSKAVAAGDIVVTFHNHPESTIPSAADFVALAKTGARFGAIACHDGSIFKYSVADDRYDGYSEEDTKEFQRWLTLSYCKRVGKGKSEPDVFRAIEMEYGVKIERIFKGSR